MEDGRIAKVISPLLHDHVSSLFARKENAYNIQAIKSALLDELMYIARLYGEDNEAVNTTVAEIRCIDGNIQSLKTHVERNEALYLGGALEEIHTYIVNIQQRIERVE